MKKIIGIALLSLPFFATFIYWVITMGLKETLFTFVGVGLLLGAVFGGAHLVQDEKRPKDKK
jgi:hypothetical protein